MTRPTVACRAALALAATLAAPSLHAQDCGSEPPDSAGVLEVAHGIIAADNARDLARVLRYYRPDARLLPPGEPPVRGRDEIRPRYTGLFGRYDPEIVGRVETIDVCGDLAVVSGRNTGSLRGRGGAADRTLNDVFVMVLRRDSAGWRIAQLMWHSGG